jgi:hypothetical protein
MLGTDLRKGMSRYSWPISTFQTQFSVPVGVWWDCNTSISVKSNIRWSCQSKHIAYALSWIAFRLVLRGPSGGSPRTFQRFQCTLLWWLVQ